MVIVRFNLGREIKMFVRKLPLSSSPLNGILQAKHINNLYVLAATIPTTFPLRKGDISMYKNNNRCIPTLLCRFHLLSTFTSIGHTFLSIFVSVTDVSLIFLSICFLKFGAPTEGGHSIFQPNSSILCPSNTYATLHW